MHYADMYRRSVSRSIRFTISIPASFKPGSEIAAARQSNPGGLHTDAREENDELADTIIARRDNVAKAYR
jgi:hypothetical protein